MFLELILGIFSVSLIKNKPDDCESDVDGEKDGNRDGVLDDGDCATKQRIRVQSAEKPRVCCKK